MSLSLLPEPRTFLLLSIPDMQPIGSEEISLSRDSGDFDPGHVAAIGGNRKRLERPFRMVLIEERPVRKTNDRCSMSFVVMVSYISTDGKRCHITGDPDGFDLRRRGIAEEILPLPVKCIEAVSRWMDDRRGQLVRSSLNPSAGLYTPLPSPLRRRTETVAFSGTS